MGQTQNSCGFRQVYSLHLIKIILDRDLAANRPDPVRILDVGNMTSHSHHTDRANSTGGAYGLSPAVLLGDCHNITCTLY